MNISIPAPITPIPATLRHDPISHFWWLELHQRADDTTTAQLKANGWRWSRYREQWRNNRRNAPMYIAVAVTVTDGGACDYASERADRLNERADCHYDRFQTQHARASAIASHIPMGQPILVGHHSEKRHRRDLARIDRAERAAFAELSESERLRGSAESSARRSAYKATAPALAKRLDRLQTEERQLARIIAGLTRRAEDGENVTTYRQQCDWRIERVRSEIAELTEHIAQAGGLVADQVEVHVGDLVNLRGFTVRITRVNRKTYSGVIVAPDNRGLDGWPGKWDRADLRGIVQTVQSVQTVRRVGEPEESQGEREE